MLHILHILPGIAHRLSKNVLTSVYKAQSVDSRVGILGDVHHLLDERPCVPLSKKLSLLCLCPFEFLQCDELGLSGWENW